MLLEQFDVGCGVGFAGRSLLCCFGQFTLLELDGTSYHLWSHHQAERCPALLVRKRFAPGFVASSCNFPLLLKFLGGISCEDQGESSDTREDALPRTQAATLVATGAAPDQACAMRSRMALRSRGRGFQ
jgi:hypothetical protein